MCADDVRWSRPRATAARLGELAPERHRFTDKRVLLSAGSDLADSRSLRHALLMSLRLLPRICTSVTARVPKACGEFIDLLRAEADRIAFGTPIGFDERARDDDFDAVLHIGSERHSSPRFVSAASCGWATQTAVGCGRYPAVDWPLAARRDFNPIGATMAASLGTAEIFKVLIGLRESRGAPADGTPFSWQTYTPSDDPGPALPHRFEFDAVLGGFGALGNGVVAILETLPLTGHIGIVDYQKFNDENLGTCVLLGPNDLYLDKATIAADRLRRAGLHVNPIPDDIARLEPSQHVPRVLVTAFDSGDARRAAQLFWPELVIDGAIGDFMAQVGRHPGDLDVDVACLRCVYPPDAATNTRAIDVATLTGLAEQRIRDNDTVSDEDVARAPDELREQLRAHIGKPTCSVVAEAVARAIANTRRDDFEPSVPFVACASAAMVVGELVRSQCGEAGPLEPRFQFDLLRGPAHGLDFARRRSASCECVTRRPAIERIRARRMSERVGDGRDAQIG